MIFKLKMMAVLLLLNGAVCAQTDMDALMLNKNSLCVGVMYSYGSWEDYWEGKLKRNNENMGTVSTQMIGVMGNYGVVKNLNLVFGAPYVITKATGGTLKGMKGVQDLSLALKWKAFTTPLANSKISGFLVGGVSVPLGNYVADFQPMSIGLHSKNLTFRGILDYQVNKFFVTGAASYMVRSNIEIDRTSYYDTEIHNTNKVDMPNVFGAAGRAGYRSKAWIAEGTVDYMNTLGGFDIRRNDMPFPSNEMDMLLTGINLKYTFIKRMRGVELTGGAKYVVKGRNVGQSTLFNAGIFYLMNLTKKAPVYDGK